SVIDYLRTHAISNIYAEPIAPLVAQQVITSMRIILGEDGTNDGRRRIDQIADNARLLHTELKRMGFIVYGDMGSPVIPLLLFNPAKIPAFSRECLARGVAVVTVGYPATPIISGRVRFCVSASHTKEDILYVLRVASEVGDRLGLKVSTRKWIPWTKNQ
ncbi:Serine palmitoyltransferase 2, partial [Gonapodya sp. JEL0774]